MPYRRGRPPENRFYDQAADRYLDGVNLQQGDHFLYGADREVLPRGRSVSFVVSLQPDSGQTEPI